MYSTSFLQYSLLSSRCFFLGIKISCMLAIVSFIKSLIFTIDCLCVLLTIQSQWMLILLHSKLMLVLYEVGKLFFLGQENKLSQNWSIFIPSLDEPIKYLLYCYIVHVLTSIYWDGRDWKQNERCTCSLCVVHETARLCH